MKYTETRMQLKNKTMKKFSPSPTATSRRKSHSQLVVSGVRETSNFIGQILRLLVPNARGEKNLVVDFTLKVALTQYKVLSGSIRPSLRGDFSQNDVFRRGKEELG